MDNYPGSASDSVEKAFQAASEIYSEYGVDTSQVIEKIQKLRISMHCWQGDDVAGFEQADGQLSGGLVATGGFPGRARNADELRQDADMAFSLIPGRHRLNLHAIYLENGGRNIDRDEVSTEHFSRWIDWAKEKDIKLDFNPTFFSHPKAESGMTLSSSDSAVRDFWIEHGKRCRKISADFAARLGGVSVVNFWVPDGMKDQAADRWGPRKRLADSYDRIFAEDMGSSVKDAVEGKLFGIGSEEYVAGSNEFYLGYAISRKKMPCLDMGHYHPTETIHDKISAVLLYVPEALVHVSRGVRWDSDHVVIFNEDVLNLAREIVRGDALDRIYLATDYFDASINRIAAWVIGIRNLQKALVCAMLEPVKELRELEQQGRWAERLALAEEFKSLPFGAVWDYFCLKENTPTGSAWLNEIRKYEKDTLAKRS